MKKKTYFYFLFLMQSYDDSMQIPSFFNDSSPTCVDNRLNLGQIAENHRISVHLTTCLSPRDDLTPCQSPRDARTFFYSSKYFAENLEFSKILLIFAASNRCVIT